MDDKDGGPAFPVEMGTQDAQYFCSRGMTLRDWFAGQAVVGLLARPLAEIPSKEVSVAALAYGLADAMLARRKE